MNAGKTNRKRQQCDSLKGQIKRAIKWGKKEIKWGK
jgi:hypothetical protein